MGCEDRLIVVPPIPALSDPEAFHIILSARIGTTTVVVDQPQQNPHTPSIPFPDPFNITNPFGQHHLRCFDTDSDVRCLNTIVDIRARIVRQGIPTCEEVDNVAFVSPGQATAIVDVIVRKQVADEMRWRGERRKCGIESW